MHEISPPDRPSFSLLSSSPAILERGRQVAAELQEEFADGTYLIRLATLGHAELLLPTIARAVALPDPGTTYPIDALRAGLQGRQALLLDSFDPILAAAPLLIDLDHG